MNLTGKLAIIFFTLVGASVAKGDIINGSFEQGFLGWNSVGGFAPVGNIGPYGPTDGVLQAGIESIIGGPSDETIAGLLGVPDTQNQTIFEQLREDAPPGETAADQCFENDDCFTLGSAAIYQSFEVTEGQEILFDFNWLAGDPTDGGWDAAFATLSFVDSFVVVLLGDGLGNGVAPLVSLAPPVELLCGTIYLSPLCNNSEPDYYSVLEWGATGYIPFTFDVPQTGTATLGFTVLSESSSFTEPSGLLIDNVRLRTVPEPGTLALLGVGLLGMGAARRRKKA